MRNYELALIIQPNINAEGVTGVVERISQFVRAGSGEVASIDVWGRKKLAYPINKQREGTYVLFQAKLAPSAIAEFERNLKLTEEVIRYLLIVKDEN